MPDRNRIVDTSLDDALEPLYVRTTGRIKRGLMVKVPDVIEQQYVSRLQLQNSLASFFSKDILVFYEINVGFLCQPQEKLVVRLQRREILVALSSLMCKHHERNIGGVRLRNVGVDLHSHCILGNRAILKWQVNVDANEGWPL